MTKIILQSIILVSIINHKVVMAIKFINRKSELAGLEEKWREKSAQLFIVYGKRRVGKTELIKQFIKKKPGVYFLADRRTHRDQLKELGRIIGRYFKDSILARSGFSDWLEVFDYLKEHVRGQFILAVDEYPYLVETDKATGSLFQKGWDEYLKDTQIFLILSGSSIAMMESETLEYKAPLYGRRTGQILLHPLNFRESWKFYPNKNFADFLKIYSVTGGMPAYIAQFLPYATIEEGIKKNILQKTGILHDEVNFILKEELREPKNYLAVLKAISWGKTKFGEIVNEAGLEKNIGYKYISVLERLKIIEREVSITEKNIVKSKKGIYKISENFFRFWFHYVFPYKSDLEIERFAEVTEKFQSEFYQIESKVYEKICQEILWEQKDNIFPFERVGRWWEGDKEIDIIATNNQTKEILFGEVKWGNKLCGFAVLNDLKKKSEFVRWNARNRKEYFILFSHSGFEPELIKRAKKEEVFLVHQDKLL